MTPPEVGLVVEVSDSSLQDDRREKGRMYARGGLPVYWVVNIPDRCTVRKARPTNGFGRAGSGRG
jgi:Uma2 family endonuclease